MGTDTYLNEDGMHVLAQQLTSDNITIISSWCHAEVVAEHDALDYDMMFQALNVPTQDGIKRATQGDYVVKGPDGQFDVVKAYQFRSKFKEV